MDETPPTNELIERLTARLSPEAREVQDEIDAIADTLDADTPEAEVEGRMDGVADLMAALPEDDRLLLQQIAQLKGRAYDERGKEYAADANLAKVAVVLIERAQALERAAGREPDEGMTLGEAVEVLEAHGEDVPVFDTERVVEVPVEPEVEVMDDAEVERIIEQMHPRVKERLARQAVKEQVQELFDEMIETGEIEFVPGTNQTQFRLVRRDEPDPS